MLDFVEGNLNENQQKELFAFLDLHPWLKAELDEFENVGFMEMPEEETFFSKNELKKNGTPDDLLVAYIENTLSPSERREAEKILAGNPALSEQLRVYLLTILKPDLNILYPAKQELVKAPFTEEQLIAYTEKLLGNAERAAIETAAKVDPSLRKDLELYQLTSLTPDIKIVFEEKESLKKEAKVIVLSQSWRYAAVAAAIALLVGLFILFFPASKQGTKGYAFIQAHGFKTVLQPDAVSQDQHQLAANSSVENSAAVHKKQVTPLYHHTVANDSLKQQNNTPLLVIAPVEETSPFKQQELPDALPGKNPIVQINKSTEDDLNDEASAEERLNAKQYIAQRIHETAWGEDTDGKPAKKKLSAFDMLAAVAKKLKSLGSKKADAKVEYNEETETSEYVLTLGKLSVTRSKSLR